MNLPRPRPLGKRHGRLSQGARKGKMSGSERINVRKIQRRKSLTLISFFSLIQIIIA